MTAKNPLDLLNRRDLVMGAGMLAMLGAQEAMAGGHTAPRVQLSEEQQAALEKANEFVTPRLLEYLESSKRNKLSSTVLNQEEIDEWFKYLPHMNYPMMVFGGKWHKTLGITKYMVGNLFRFRNLKKYPKLKPYVLG